jgi:hypothetical protein
MIKSIIKLGWDGLIDVIIPVHIMKFEIVI